MKTVLITGAAKGIGASIARKFAHNEYNIAINFNSSMKQAEALCLELAAIGVQAISIKADLTNQNDILNLVSTTIKTFGHIDVLINNAGISIEGLFFEEDFKKTFDIINTNVLTAMNVTKETIKHMLPRGCGNIVNISSIWGVVGACLEVSYSTSKAALIGFTKALSKEISPNGIRVNCVSPGAIKTDMLNGYSEVELQEIINSTDLGRLGSADDIADAVYFLSSENASFITGQNIIVDGGFID